MDKNITWVLVADSANAKIFSTHKAKLLQENGNGESLQIISKHEHAESREMDHELMSDGLGQFGPNTFSPRTDPKRHEEEIFAVQVSKILVEAHKANKYHDIICIAPPTFMGLLHKHIPENIKQLVSLYLEKDYTKETTQNLVSKLKDHL